MARMRTKNQKPLLNIPKSWVKPEDDDTEYICPTVWCDKCRRDVPFFVHKTRRYGSVHGERYRYRGKKANCNICGNTVYRPEVILYNFRKLILESKKEKCKEKENGE